MTKEKDAAEAFRSTYGGDHVKQVDSYLGFLAGIAYRDAHPSAEVLELVKLLIEATDGQARLVHLPWHTRVVAALTAYGAKTEGA